MLVKFIYTEKTTKFCEIFTLLLSYVGPVKSKVKISQNFVAFSEYMNFNLRYFLGKEELVSNSAYLKLLAQRILEFLWDSL